MSNAFGGSYRLNAEGSRELVEEPTFDPHHSIPVSPPAAVEAVIGASEPEPAPISRRRGQAAPDQPEAQAPETPAAIQE